MKAHDPKLLEQLRTYNSPTVANAIEVFDVRPRNEGFMRPEIRCIFPNMGVMVGYAVTVKIQALTAGSKDATIYPSEHWKDIMKVPAPRVVVVEDLDEPSGVGSLWGEVNANMHKAMGCVGVVTNGSVRDLDEVEPLGNPGQTPQFPKNGSPGIYPGLHTVAARENDVRKNRK